MTPLASAAAHRVLIWLDERAGPWLDRHVADRVYRLAARVPRLAALCGWQRREPAPCENDNYRDTAIIRHGDGHAGFGWYLWSEDYPDEGSLGAFETRGEAERFALENDYRLNSKS